MVGHGPSKQSYTLSRPGRSPSSSCNGSSVPGAAGAADTPASGARGVRHELDAVIRSLWVARSNAARTMSIRPPSSAAAEASVRQLIASGDHKTALEQAKELHRASSTITSEALLVDAYAERIRSLIRRNLTVEAKSLIELVRQRYPSSRTRLDQLMPRVVARYGSLDDLVRPLGDPALGVTERVSVERVLQQEVWDLNALAGCDALPLDHPLRTAAAAIERAFVAATSGPVADEALALPEISHRSPLAPWKLLTRAIASYYRGEISACQRYLDGIHPESAPARLRARDPRDAHARNCRTADSRVSRAARSDHQEISGCGVPSKPWIRPSRHPAQAAFSKPSVPSSISVSKSRLTSSNPSGSTSRYAARWAASRRRRSRRPWAPRAATTPPS